MTEQPDNDSFSQSDLQSPVYRQRLMRKLNCLIAVLEVACAKVRRSLDGPDPDIDRLERIQSNLRETLQVCRRAKQALERKEQLPDDLPAHLTQLSDDQPALERAEIRAYRGRRVEMTSEVEFERFDGLKPIAADELQSVDLDDLTRRLQE